MALDDNVFELKLKNNNIYRGSKNSEMHNYKFQKYGMKHLM